MAFNSVMFFVVFMPCAVLGYYLLALSPLHRLRLPFLILMGLIFYGRAQVSYIPLLVGSIVINYLIAKRIVANTGRDRAKRAWLTIGVVLDSGLLLCLKYLSAVAGTFAAGLGHRSPLPNIIAPLAISFYTFQQISFLVDVSRGKVAPDGFTRYMAFVSFFPTLLAGPITLYSEMGPQFGVRPQRKGVTQNILIGSCIFALGLFKKTVLADTAGIYVDHVYANVHQAGAGHGSAPGFLLSWAVAFTYTLQIYFDFSGYCDMAIGVARMIGIVLPLNFFSPLRSLSIADLWRRWHMTLGRFVRTYIHQPLSIPLTRYAVNKGYGKWTSMTISVFLPTFLSMLIIGTWHGPNWTFVVFGVMHGSFMVINELYNALTRKKRRKKPDSRAMLFGYGLLTLLAFVSAEIPFRADNVTDASRIFAGALGLNGLGVNPDWPTLFRPTGNGIMLPIIVLGLLIVYFLPNTEQIMDKVHPALEWQKWRIVDPARISIPFRFNPAWIAVVSVILFFGFAFISRGTTKFIYFNF
jgi:D-alanyl-lipoteichoic acid acyltransferase DltB (MBOAT superfamily)